MMNQQFSNKAAVLLLILCAVLNSFTLRGQNNPPLTVTIYDSAAASGYFFVAPYVLSPPYTYDHPQMILDRYGNTIYYRVFLNGGIAATTADFKLQSNGQMSFYSPVLGKFYLMDSTFTVVDSVIAANGYGTDTHELQILSDGHYLILGREMRIKNLVSVRWFGPSHNLPGSPNAEVTGSVVQELDENKNLLFQWKAHDHFDFKDVDSVWLNNPTSVDWTHSNALERDYDGNILLSSRHLNEITKINRNTGAIIWRLGGKHNDFDFINDTIGFTGQHDIRRQANGHITLWDNGQFTDPPLGRSLEYSLDEIAMQAKVEWGYIQDSGMFSYAMGNHQVLPGGRRFLTFGFISPPFPMAAYVKEDSTRILEIYGPPAYGCYRAFHYDTLPFTIPRPAVHCEKTGNTWYLVAEPGHGEYLWSTGATSQSIPVTSAGRYQVFVPYGGGGGHAGSEIMIVKNLSDPCGEVPLNRSLQNEVVPAGQDICFDAMQTITVAGNGSLFQVQNGGAANLVSGQNILFKEGMSVSAGGYLHGFITTTNGFCPAPAPVLPGVVAATEENITHAATEGSVFSVFPNPTAGKFYVMLNKERTRQTITVELLSMQGLCIWQKKIADVDRLRFSVCDQPSGIYLLRVTTAGGSETRKLVVASHQGRMP